VGRAAAGETAGEGALVWADEIVRVLSNAAAAQLIGLRRLGIKYLMGFESYCRVSRAESRPAPFVAAG
jgi:hypothetical protein